MTDFMRYALINALECADANAEKRGDDAITIRLTREDLAEIIRDMHAADRHTWHDLKKNPNDLPTKDGEYLVEYVKGTHNVRLFLNGTFAVNYESKASLANIVAWKEIEPFEQEEENNV